MAVEVAAFGGATAAELAIVDAKVTTPFIPLASQITIDTTATGKLFSKGVDPEAVANFKSAVWVSVACDNVLLSNANAASGITPTKQNTCSNEGRVTDDRDDIYAGGAELEADKVTWVQVDLGSSIIGTFYGKGSGNGAVSNKFQYSVNGTDWTDIGSVTGGATWVLFGITARYLRAYFDNTGGGAGTLQINEMAFFADSAAIINASATAGEVKTGLKTAANDCVLIAAKTTATSGKLAYGIAYSD